MSTLVNNATIAPPAEVAVLSDSQQQALLKRIQSNMPATHFKSISPSELPSMYLLKTEEGEMMYTEASGRFLYLGMVIDTQKWKVLDNMTEGNQDVSTDFNSGDTQ
jgi:hypothetical protein